jgi:hypothetical protein
MFDAAVEVDRRFGLKERVSSALMLQPEERETEFGQALIRDAERRVEMIVVPERFHIQASWKALSPVLPVTAAFAIAFLLPDARHAEVKAAMATAQQRQQIKKSAQELKERLHKKQQELEKKGLLDAEELFRKITQGVDELDKKDDVDQRKALVKLNDLAKELAQRRDALGDSEKMKRQFDKLKELEKGPADKLADALKEGNFEKAVEELQKLREQLAKGDLSPEEKEQLARQLNQMKQRLQEMAEAHEEAKRELKRQIEQKMAQGDMDAVNKLQKKLDELEKANKQMSRLESMASKCEACENAMKSGDAKKAADALADLEKDLESMQADLEQLETIDEIMDELADAKDGMAGEGEPMDRFGAGQSEMQDMFGMGDGLNEGQ